MNNVDLEGLVADNLRQRTVNENLRQLLLRVVAGFHMKIPDHAQRKGQWYEYHSNLMNLPSLTSSRGSTTMAHTVSRHVSDGYEYQLVQTLGQGVVSVNLPNWNANALTQSSGGPGPVSSSKMTSVGDAMGGGGGGPAAPDMNAPPAFFQGDVAGRESEIEATYKLDSTGVAVFERDTGIMTERVWVTRGQPTASSAGGTLNNMFRNVGTLRMIGEKEAPDVGPTGQIGWPFMPPMEGLFTWTDLDVAPR